MMNLILNLFMVMMIGMIYLIIMYQHLNQVKQNKQFKMSMTLMINTVQVHLKVILL